MKCVILMRHGRTAHNTARIFQSDSAEIDEVGRSQVEESAKHLGSIVGKIDVILCSPLLRARQSADIISKSLLVPVLTEPLLKEFQNPPQIRGKSYDNPEADLLYQKWISMLDLPTSTNQSDIENYYDLSARAKNVLDMFATSEFSNALAVSHSEIIRAVVARILLPENDSVRLTESILNHIKIDNAHFITIMYNDDKSWKLML